MFCVNCGKKLDKGEKFCPNCGTVVQSAMVMAVDNSFIDEETIAKLSRLEQVLMQIEEEEYYINLCEYMLDSMKFKNSLRTSLQIVAHPIVGTAAYIKDEVTIKRELGKRGITAGVCGFGYTKGKRKLEENIQVIANQNLDLAGLVPDRYLCSSFINYLIAMIEEKRVTSMAEAYNLLDDQIHRWSMEEKADMQQQSLNMIKTYLTGWF